MPYYAKNPIRLDQDVFCPTCGLSLKAEHLELQIHHGTGTSEDPADTTAFLNILPDHGCDNRFVLPYLHEFRSDCGKVDVGYMHCPMCEGYSATEPKSYDFPDYSEIIIEDNIVKLPLRCINFNCNSIYEMWWKLPEQGPKQTLLFEV